MHISKLSNLPRNPWQSTIISRGYREFRCYCLQARVSHWFKRNIFRGRSIIVKQIFSNQSLWGVTESIVNLQAWDHVQGSRECDFQIHRGAWVTILLFSLSVNQTYCGHGIGKEFHIAPNVPHYAGNKASGFMKPGHVFTIEPMINAGVQKDITWPDNWTAVTADGQRSAQFEHTILITETSHELLTARLPTSPKL